MKGITTSIPAGVREDILWFGRLFEVWEDFHDNDPMPDDLTEASIHYYEDLIQTMDLIAHHIAVSMVENIKTKESP